jgi:hypothetical protein
MRSLLLTTAVVVVLAAACANSTTPCGPDLDYDETCVAVDVTSTATFDSLAIDFGGGAGFDPDIMAQPIVTPALAASGQLPTTVDIEVVNSSAGDEIDELETPARSWSDTEETLYPPMHVTVIAFSGAAIAGGAHADLDDAAIGDMRGLAGSIAIDPTADAEMWGIAGSNAEGVALDDICLRVVDAAGTHYVVRRDDYDCDGIANETDCKPFAFCDPAATTPGGIAACQCD